MGSASSRNRPGLCAAEPHLTVRAATPSGGGCVCQRDCVVLYRPQWCGPGRRLPLSAWTPVLPVVHWLPSHSLCPSRGGDPPPLDTLLWFRGGNRSDRADLLGNGSSTSWTNSGPWVIKALSEVVNFGVSIT